MLTPPPPPLPPPARVLVQDAPLFVDVSERALPGVSTTSGTAAKEWIIEVNGGGVALEDFDRDGHLDLLLVDGSTVERAVGGERGLPPRLFLNRGDGTFQPAGDGWNMAGGRWGTGVATGDWNGDGWTDLVVTEWGADRVFLNVEGGGWREVTQAAGLAAEGWSTSAAVLDYDGDGHLDLFVLGYLAFDPSAIAPASAGTAQWKGHSVMVGPEGLRALPDRLYRGRGDGTFEEVSERAGVRAVEPAFGLGAMTLDFDLDGDIDLYVANDSTPNHLWENQGDGTFREVGFRRGVAYDGHGREQAGMGIACADLDGDRRPELLVTNFSGESNAFYRAAGSRGSFRERAAAAALAGPSLTRLGWGTGFVDVDLDGARDLFVLNGHVYPQSDRAGTDTSYAQGDQLFLARGGRFVEAPLVAGDPRVSRAGTYGDLDSDGDPDLVIVAVDGPVRVLENRSGGERHWLRVRLAGRGANRAGIGATVAVEAGGVTQWAEVRTAGGFQSAVPAELYFGFGAAELPEGAERVTVRWPAGGETVLEDVPLDQRLSIEEGK